MVQYMYLKLYTVIFNKPPLQSNNYYYYMFWQLLFQRSYPFVFFSKLLLLISKFPVFLCKLLLCIFDVMLESSNCINSKISVGVTASAGNIRTSIHVDLLASIHDIVHTETTQDRVTGLTPVKCYLTTHSADSVDLHVTASVGWLSSLDPTCL